ncbi:hypothetical protein [Massilibacteroides sp.]|uniref:hypothetical protein n=1 Tax=Massilibacteroides sp. TaxID=2034766 RepID=UPI00260B4841|nr:hypothetical protein [Massilibacteroides sp.]MDD4516571.1 hypothetical protein [Massilibacteroides sp.]
MFGGTAKTYANWRFDSEPYQEGKVYYIDAVNPKTNTVKKVRWYCDAAHAALMPNRSSDCVHKRFLFPSDSLVDENNYILVIKATDVSTDEELKFLRFKWRFACRLGGIWYSAQDTQVPTALREKVNKLHWKNFT